MAARSVRLGGVAEPGVSARCAAVRKLEARMDAGAAGGGSLLCVGLDPVPAQMPGRFCTEPHPLFAFCRYVADATAPACCAFKPNTAFFEAEGVRGWEQLEMLFTHLRTDHPEHFTICDAKRGDIGSTNAGYVRAVFDGLGADAVTLHPYLGREALEPFLAREDKVSIVLCRTSNPGAGELQDLSLEGRPLWRRVAEQVSEEWNRQGNCMLVVGATWPAEMRAIRAAAPATTFLVPGIGAQGGDIEAVVQAGLRADGKGLIISSSRAIAGSADPGRAARDTRDAIERAREALLGGR